MGTHKGAARVGFEPARVHRPPNPPHSPGVWPWSGRAVAPGWVRCPSVLPEDVLRGTNMCPTARGKALPAAGRHRPSPDVTPGCGVWVLQCYSSWFLGVEPLLRFVSLCLDVSVRHRSETALSDVFELIIARSAHLTPITLKHFCSVIYLNANKLYISGTLVIHVKIIWSQLNITYLCVLSGG